MDPGRPPGFLIRLLIGHNIYKRFRRSWLDEFMLLADNLEQRIKTRATFGNFSTRSEAQQYFNINAFNMLMSQNQEKYEMEYYQQVFWSVFFNDYPVITNLLQNPVIFKTLNFC